MNMPTSLRHALALVLFMPLAFPALAQEPSANNPLQLNTAAIKETGIVLAQAGLRPVTDTFKAPGEVKADAYSTVLVSPRVESQVLAREVKLGDIVEAGDPLVKLSSVPVAKAETDLIVAELDWKRVSALGPKAVSARRYNESRIKRDQARAKLRAYGLPESEIKALLRAGSAKADGSYRLLAPISGRVTTDDFLVGERVAPGRTLITLVKEDTVWVVAQVSPGDAEKVDAGDSARILAHGTSLTGSVVQRSHQTSERTRTVPVRIEVNNSKDLLHPGELVNVRVATGSSSEVLSVPAKAVLLLKNQPTVFVPKDKGQFEPVPVVTGDTRDGWVQIKQGLKPGQTYVREGAFALKARLLRAQLGAE